MKLYQAFCYNPAVIIDFHTHIFSPKIKAEREPYLSDPCFATLYSDRKARLATAEDLIESMDKEGVDVSVALNIDWTSHDLCVETNDYILESVSRYPKRLVGFCAVQPTLTDKTAKEIERCAKAGAKGIGELRPGVRALDPGKGEVIASFMATMKKHRLILLTHSSEPVGHLYKGKGVVTPDLLYSLITAAEGVPLVCAHWGGGLPFYALMPEMKQALNNVYFDSAASPYLYSPQIYNQVSRLVGADKILFGTDYPLLKPKRLLNEIDSLNLPLHEKELILSGNARKLLGI